MYKNIEKQTALELREQVDYQAGQIISRTLVQNELMSMTLFAFEKGEEISHPRRRRRRHGDGAGGHRPLHRGRAGVPAA